MGETELIFKMIKKLYFFSGYKIAVLIVDRFYGNAERLRQ